jgi:hypothetical protein
VNVEGIRLFEGFCPIPGHPPLQIVMRGAGEFGACSSCSTEDVTVDWFTDSHNGRDTAFLATVGHGLNWGTSFDMNGEGLQPLNAADVRGWIDAGIAACRRRIA